MKESASHVSQDASTTQDRSGFEAYRQLLADVRQAIDDAPLEAALGTESTEDGERTIYGCVECNRAWPTHEYGCWVEPFDDIYKRINDLLSGGSEGATSAREELAAFHMFTPDPLGLSVYCHCDDCLARREAGEGGS